MDPPLRRYYTPAEKPARVPRIEVALPPSSGSALTGAWRAPRTARTCPSQRRSGYCLAIKSKNMDARREYSAMMRVQPERQEIYGGDKTKGTLVFESTDQDNGTGFAAKHARA